MAAQAWFATQLPAQRVSQLPCAAAPTALGVSTACFACSVLQCGCIVLAKSEAAAHHGSGGLQSTSACESCPTSRQSHGPDAPRVSCSSSCQLQGVPTSQVTHAGQLAQPFADAPAWLVTKTFGDAGAGLRPWQPQPHPQPKGQRQCLSWPQPIAAASKCARQSARVHNSTKQLQHQQVSQQHTAQRHWQNCPAWRPHACRIWGIAM